MAAITREQKIREHYAEAGFSAEQALALADGATATRDWHREDMDNLAQKFESHAQRIEKSIENHLNGLRWWMITMSFVTTVFIGVSVTSLGIAITSRDGGNANPVIANYYAAPAPVATAPVAPPSN